MAKLIICLDGLGYDLIKKEDTPFLYFFAKKNHFSRLKTLFAFTGLEYAFFTGKTPEENNIWLEFLRKKNSIFSNFLLRFFSFNKKIRDFLAILIQIIDKRTWLSGLHNIPSDKIKYFDTSTKNGLWKTDFFQKRKFSFYKWPFFVVKNGKEKVKIILKYENDEERLKRVLKVKNKDVYYTQLLEIDKIIHRYGKNNKETKKYLRKIDKLIEKYVSNFVNEHKNAQIVLWSDHGFADVKKYIDIIKILPKRRDYLYFIAGTTASFWFDNEKVRKEVLKRLKSIEGTNILTKEKAKKFKVPFSKDYGELIVYLNKGNYFFPNFYQRTEKEKFKAMHGYPEDKELDGIFISNIHVKKDMKINEVIEVLK